MRTQTLLFATALSVSIMCACSRQDNNSSTDNQETEAADTLAITKQSAEVGTTTDPESFQEEDARTFSKLLANRKDLKTPEDLIRLYYNFPIESLGTSAILIDSTELEPGKFEIILIHDKLEDDSLLGIKLVMNAAIKNGIWTVEAVKRNWRCREGRGPQEWGLESCV